MRNAPKSLLRDGLAATTDEGKIELIEEQLSRVIGGSAEYLKIKLTDVIISSYKAF
jgi:hypothetical protein